MADRRRIEREFHDGVQQHLVAVIVNLQLARELADTDLEGAKAVLDELSADAHHALESVRELGHELYPSLLRDRGPVEAVRAAAVGVGRAGSRRNGSDRGVGTMPMPPSTTAVSSSSATSPSTPGAGARATVRLWQEDGAVGSRSATTEWASIRARRGVTAGSRASPMRWAPSGARSRSTRVPGRGARVAGSVPVAS